MAYPHRAISVLVASSLILLAPSALADRESSPSRPSSPLPSMAALLLEHASPDTDPLALEQARELAAGRPGKAWKNCLVEKEAHRISAGLVAQTEGPRGVPGPTPESN